MARACIGIGSNVGDRPAHIAAAREALARFPETRLVAFSGVYETAPVGYTEQGAFLNAAALLETGLEPDALLAELRRIEQQHGRERRERWGPRTLDLDVLLYDERTIQLHELTVPHPRMHERWFVLKPLADVAAEMRHPVLGKTVGELLAEVE